MLKTFGLSDWLSLAAQWNIRALRLRNPTGFIAEWPANERQKLRCGRSGKYTDCHKRYAAK